jgi:pyruvate/2-oxoglutarate/acetoin dehydrogenase E1 component
MLWNTPGLKLALPSTPQDAASLMRAAVHDPNPVVVFDHQRLFNVEDDVDDAAPELELGKAAIRRRGRDVTILATSLMVRHALLAAEELERAGISAEVVDPRTLVPLDEATIFESVARTGRLVAADESHLSCGVASEIAARVGYALFDRLKAPVERVATVDVPVPFSPTLEPLVAPGVRQIVEATLRTMQVRGLQLRD